MGGRHCWCGPWRGVFSAWAALHKVVSEAVGPVACTNEAINAMALLPSIAKLRENRQAVDWSLVWVLTDKQQFSLTEMVD